MKYSVRKSNWCGWDEFIRISTLTIFQNWTKIPTDIPQTPTAKSVKECHLFLMCNIIKLFYVYHIYETLFNKIEYYCKIVIIIFLFYLIYKHIFLLSQMRRRGKYNTLTHSMSSCFCSTFHSGYLIFWLKKINISRNISSHHQSIGNLYIVACT